MQLGEHVSGPEFVEKPRIGAKSGTVTCFRPRKVGEGPARFFVESWVYADGTRELQFVWWGVDGRVLHVFEGAEGQWIWQAHVGEQFVCDGRLGADAGLDRRMWQWVNGGELPDVMDLGSQLRRLMQGETRTKRSTHS